MLKNHFSYAELRLVAAMLLSTGSLLANNLDGVNPAKTLSTKISKLLSNNSLTENEVNVKAQVLFTINNEGDIVVLSVETDNRAVGCRGVC